MLPIIALVGRPNVGKSSLFNRLLRKGRAITHDRPGVTRDRIQATVSHVGVEYVLVDTGGMVPDSRAGEIERAVFEQAGEAVAEAQAVILVVDGREGLSPLDQEAAALVRRSGKPALVLVNKVDGPELVDQALAEFHSLGFEVLAVSAAHGLNLEQVRDRTAELAAGLEVPGRDEARPELGLRLSVLGRPNVGKSSLINALAGQERLIVSEQAGTTRDSVDVTFEIEGRRYTFIDTAGVRRKANIVDSLERFSVLRALGSSRRSNVTVLVLDASEGLTRQDKRLLSFLADEKAPFLVAVNKIDLAPRAELADLKKAFSSAMRVCPHAPLVYVSALAGQGLARILPLAEQIHVECGLRVGTGQLNRAVREVVEAHQPPMVNRRRAKFYYLTQADQTPPTFVFFVNAPELIKASYARYLENGLRRLFGIKTAPLSVIFRPSHAQKPEPKSRPKAKAKAAPKPGPKSGPKPKPGFGPKSKSKSGPKPGSKPKSGPKSGSKPGPKPKSGSK
ncbi:MAG: ribosome biogenesis GTPase Der, partial [Desulfovibrionaceae bacterium]|nr:ribosome biogenesis GTPase Der [Desulfovibrionaceae bacterium]